MTHCSSCYLYINKIKVFGIILPGRDTVSWVGWRADSSHSRWHRLLEQGQPQGGGSPAPGSTLPGRIPVHRTGSESSLSTCNYCHGNYLESLYSGKIDGWKPMHLSEKLAFHPCSWTVAEKETFHFTLGENNCSCAVESKADWACALIVQWTFMKRWLSYHFRVQVFKNGTKYGS